MRNLEYERHAAEYRRLAAQMKNTQQKEQLEDMAEIWEKLARARRQAIVDNTRKQ